jgi:hypothetical protein
MAPPWRRREKATDRSKIDATPPWEVRQRDNPEPTTGPFDVRDMPDDDRPRVDLGALRVPVWEGIDLRLDVNEAQQVVSATLASADGQMQLGVFAAPRNEGIWDDVRDEIRQSLASQGGSTTDEPDGPFGPELRGTLKGPEGSMPVNATKAAPFEDALRAIVVVRGSEPLPVREPVPLQLPKEAADQLGAGQPSPADS